MSIHGPFVHDPSRSPFEQARQVIRAVRWEHLKRAGYATSAGKNPLTPTRSGDRLFGVDLDDDGVKHFTQEVLDMFTQSHYEAFARQIEKTVMAYDASGNEEARRVIVQFMNDMCNDFERDNPKFKKLRFIEAALAKANEKRSSHSQKE